MIDSRQGIKSKQICRSSSEDSKRIRIAEWQTITEKIVDFFDDRRVEDTACRDGQIELRLHGGVKVPLVIGILFRVDVYNKKRGNLGRVVAVSYDDGRPAVDD